MATPVTIASPPADRRWTARKDLIFYGALIVLLALMLVRITYGMEWYGDETYALSTPTRYVHGDRPIVDSWESHFSSGMLLTPFVAALDKIYPDGTGIVIGFRYLFVILQVIFVFAVWRTIRPLIPPWAPILSACMVFLYLPYFYVFPYYNNIAVSLFTLSGLSLFRARAESGRTQRGFILAAGVLSGFGVVAYPTMLLALPFFGLGIALTSRREPERMPMKRSLLYYGAAVGAVLGAFAVVAVLASGVTQLRAALPEFLNPVDRDTSLHAMGARLLRTSSVLVPSAATLVTVAVGMLATSRLKGAIARHGALIAASLGIVAAVVVAFGMYKLKIPGLSYLDMQQGCALAVAVILPLIALRVPRDLSAPALALLTLPALGVAVGTLPASHEGFETAAMPALLAMLGTLFVLSALATDALLEPDGRRVRWLFIASWGLLLAFFTFTGMQYVGGDAVVRQLDTRLTTGPYAGVHTTALNAEKYARYLRVLGPLRSEPGRIAFVEEFPQGYVLTGRRPGTYSVWTTFSTGDRWQRYLDITHNYPTTIVSTLYRGPNGGFGTTPFVPPFGLRDFSAKYREAYRDGEFVVWEQVR